MAAAACRRALLGVHAMGMLAGSSWVARPLSHYAASAPGEDREHGVRSFSHAEKHDLDDGSRVELAWEVKVDPATVLALDVEEDIRLLDCKPQALLLDVPNEHLHRVKAWRYVTASDARHSCSHLRGSDLYHRVHGINGFRVSESQRKGAALALATEELPSHAHVFPSSNFNFVFTPAEVRAQEPIPDENSNRNQGSDKHGHVPRASIPRRLMPFFNGRANVVSSLTPVASNNAGNSLPRFNIPHQLSNLTWNWDYAANSTENPQFKYTFPGGQGFMRLYKPYFKSHFGISITFNSRFDDFMSSPNVDVHAVLQGYTDINADVAVAMNFDTDSSATMFNNILDHVELPRLENLTHRIEHEIKRKVENITALRLWLGGVGLSIKPWFSCKMKAYHLGQLKGSMRVSLAGRLQLRAVMHFSTGTGLETHIAARMSNVQFTPPTWMLWTKHFELGVMLEPELWLSGNLGMGDKKDMQLGLALRPYLNVSISDQQPGSGNDNAELVAYPLRMIGLPTSRSYAVEVCANGRCSRTVSLLSIGLVEFDDSIEHFSFGEVMQSQLNTTLIEVLLWEDGVQVARGQAVCDYEIGGLCQPSPMSVPLQVENSTAIVQLKVYWRQNAMHSMMKKVKSLSVRFPMVSFMQQQVADALVTPELLDSARLVLKHNGRAYSVPLTTTALKSTMLLESRICYELGPVFLESWSYMGSPESPSPLLPLVEITIGGMTVARGILPSLDWAMATSGSMDDMSVLTSGIGQFETTSEVTAEPVTVALYDPRKPQDDAMLATAKVEFSLLPADKSAFFVSPSEAEVLAVGQQYNLRWVATGAHRKTKQTFYITAKTVAKTGGVTEVGWLHSCNVSCVPDGSLQVHQYIGQEEAPCVFQVPVAIPKLLAGSMGVFVVNWIGKNLILHEMISPLLQFPENAIPEDTHSTVEGDANSTVGGRRLEFLGKTNTTKSTVDANVKKNQTKTTNSTVDANMKKKLQALASHCHSRPLKYAVGAGINAVEHVKNVMSMTSTMMSGMGGGENGGDKGKSEDWVSKPIPVFDINNNSRLSAVLPKDLCANGICEGFLPGCRRSPSGTRHIKQIVVQLSRLFKWKKHIGPKLRHIIAYGLALLPSSIQIGGQQLEHMGEHQAEHLEEEALHYFSRTTTDAPTKRTTSTASATGTAAPAAAAQTYEAPQERRLGAAPAAAARRRGGAWEVETEDAGAPEPEELAEFDTFVVRIVDPMPYELTDDLLRGLLSRGAFRGIEDGSEGALGPIHIRDLALREAPPARPAVAGRADEGTSLFQPGGPGVTAALPSWLARGRGAMVSVCAAVIAPSALLLAMAAIARRRGYVQLAPAGLRKDLPTEGRE